MNTGWLLRMARWARRPPSEGRVLWVLIVVAICAALVAVEWLMGGWPEVLTPDRGVSRGLPR